MYNTIRVDKQGRQRDRWTHIEQRLSPSSHRGLDDTWRTVEEWHRAWEQARSRHTMTSLMPPHVERRMQSPTMEAALQRNNTCGHISGFTLQNLILSARICCTGFILQHCWVVDFNKKHAKPMAKIELCREWAPWPSASATYRQTGWDLHQHGWWNDACATPQRRLRHELAWIWTDFLNEQRQTTGLVEIAVGRAAMTACRMLAQDSR